MYIILPKLSGPLSLYQHQREGPLNESEVSAHHPTWRVVTHGIMLLQVAPMREEFDESEGPDLECLCQGVSHYPATVHCPACKKWFCDAHAEEGAWRSCVLDPGEKGGEAQQLADGV